VTLSELAADPDFDPDVTGMCGHDRRPWGSSAKRGGRTRTRVAERTRCRVVGCGVPYAPAGVCGYCRQRVRILRSQQPQPQVTS
jgi:hypothetical protein